MRKRLWSFLGISLAICVGWHLVLYLTPTDGLAGTTNFQGDLFKLAYFAPPESQWSESGVSVYRAILRVDAQSMAAWFTLPPEKRGSWQMGSSHQYLVDRRDDDGKRVINTPLQLPNSLDHLGPAALAALVTLLAVIAIGVRVPDLSALPALIMLAGGTLLGLSWATFGMPFSYIALMWPFWSQLALHILGNTIVFGALAHIALTYLAPLDWYTDHKWAALITIYGIYPAGLLIIILLQPEITVRLTTLETWEQQASILLRGIAYAAWGAQYRRATVSQRGQLHWVLGATAAYDLPYLLSAIAGSESLIQSWLGILPPLGYLIAILPGRRLRFRLSVTSGFIHGITNTLMAALFLSGLGLAANFLITNGQSASLPAATIGLAVIFALATLPLMDLLREQLDSWFNGTRGAQRALLHQFTGKVSQQIALPQVTSAFRETLDQGIQPAFAALWLWNAETQALQSLDLVADVPEIIPLDEISQRRLLDLTTFTPRGHLIFWPDGELRDRYVGAISLISSGTLIGVCALGPRIDDGAYSRDALAFLETLIRSATLAFRNAQLVSQLEDKIAALRSAYQQLITAQESERRNLAAELHDETLQQLAHANLITAQVQMATASDHPNHAADTTLHELQQTITLTERRLREILKGIHPSVLTDLGLEAALRSWLPRPVGVKITFAAPDFGGRRLPDPELEMTLYRLAQESVNNALKHAQAQHIEIRLQWREDRVTLDIIDDGLGFTPALRFTILHRPNGEGHFGLLNLQERVRAFGGTLQIISQPGNGTHISAQLPMKEKSPEK